MGLNLLALGSSRLPSLIRAVSLQGMVLGVMPLLMEHESRLAGGAGRAGHGGGQGLVIPALLRRAMRAAQHRPRARAVHRLRAVAAARGGRRRSRRWRWRGALPLLPEHAGSLLVPGALATVLTGFILLIGRTKAISQVCGYLILENGIYLFGLLLIHSTPLLVEAGILLDLTVGVFVIGIIVDRIQRAFDSLDTRKLTTLRE